MKCLQRGTSIVRNWIHRDSPQQKPTYCKSPPGQISPSDLVTSKELYKKIKQLQAFLKLHQGSISCKHHKGNLIVFLSCRGGLIWSTLQESSIEHEEYGAHLKNYYLDQSKFIFQKDFLNYWHNTEFWKQTRCLFLKPSNYQNGFMNVYWRLKMDLY